MSETPWAIGIDLGGTKIEAAQVYGTGQVGNRVRLSTEAESGPGAIEEKIVAAIRQVVEKAEAQPAGVGLGVAGQVERETGVIRFSPNLGWHEVPLKADLQRSLDMPIIVTNDVRAATWGEWLHGAGLGCDDLVCLFVGTGIGGAIVSGGQMLLGARGNAGELGHTTVDLNGPACRCHNRGCLEALAGGWAMARQAQEAIRKDMTAGAALVKAAGGQLEAVSAETVASCARAGDSLARRLVEEEAHALIAGCVSFVNAFNPSRLILGGGVIEGLPELVGQIEQGIRQRALPASADALRVFPAQLHGDAGIIGAGTLALRVLARIGETQKRQA